MIKPTQEFWKVFKETYGAFSTPEAIALYNIALQAPQGEYLELGTHKGKSTLAAMLGLKKGKFYLVDPIFEDDNICSEMAKTFYSFPSTHIEKVLIADYSTNVIHKHSNLSFVFLDSGDHGEELVKEEVQELEDRLMGGGILAFHDYQNQFTAVERWYDYLVGTGKYEPIAIDWKEIFDYVRENNLEDGNNSWHEKGSEEFPKFVGALRRK